MSNLIDYSKYARNEYSQFGEDGIIEYIISKLPDKDKWCVEFGAWDGIYLSNTFNLVKNHGYRPVLIEADKKKFQVLQANMASFEAVLLNKFVSFDGANTLDKILEKIGIPIDFDLLSIDIDGNDYWIFDSIVEFRPKIICIEYNPSIPNSVEYIQPRNFLVKRGASALSIWKLAKQKSYELISATCCNLIFVDKKYFNLFQPEETPLSSLRNDDHCRIYAFVGYDGTIIHSRPIHFTWHNFTIAEEALQSLPRLLRKFPPDYNIFQKLLLAAFLLLIEPTRTLRRLYTRLKKQPLGPSSLPK